MCLLDFLSSRVACQRPTPAPTHPAVVLGNFSKSHHAPPKCAYINHLFLRFRLLTHQKRCVVRFFTATTNSRLGFIGKELLMRQALSLRRLLLTHLWVAADQVRSNSAALWMRWTLLIRAAICHVLPTKGAIMREEGDVFASRVSAVKRQALARLQQGWKFATLNRIQLLEPSEPKVPSRQNSHTRYLHQCFELAAFGSIKQTKRLSSSWISNKNGCDKKSK